MRMAKVYIIAFWITMSNLLYSKNIPDSLNDKIGSCHDDSTLMKLNYKLASYYINNDECSKALAICEKMSPIYHLPKNKKYMCDFLFLKTRINYSFTRYDSALVVAFNCLKTAESINYESVKGKVFVQIGNIFFTQKNIKKAIKYYKKAIIIGDITNNDDILDASYSNLGIIYQDEKKLDSSLYYYNQSLNISIKNRDSIGIADGYGNIGTVYFNKKDYKLAKKHFEDALNIYLKYNAQYQLAISYVNIASVLDAEYKYDEAENLYLKAIEIGKKLKNNSLLYSAYEALASNYYNNSNFKEAYNAVAFAKSYNDSTYSEEMSMQTAELQTKYETEKKEQENQVLTLENKNKKQVIYFAFGGCALLLGLVFFIFKGYKQKQKANHELEVKNEIIQQQKAIVEEQHQDIKDSIKYAQRIQGAILPPKNMWQKILPNSFLLYMPKDVLSGDFYWIEETKDYTYVAAADCTGHGVPGALVSIVNFNLLNKAVLEKDLVLPSDILDAVNIWLTESLHQSYGESAVRDGMDVTLIAIPKHSNEVLFAGANNPIYHVSNGELKQIKGDKFPVGAFIEDKIQKFTTKRFMVEKGDSIFLFSDGFADQFGGPKGKKYKYAQFQEKLKMNCDLPLTQQYDVMRKEFLDWKGTHEQVDDVLLIGIKIA